MAGVADVDLDADLQTRTWEHAVESAAHPVLAFDIAHHNVRTVAGERQDRGPTDADPAAGDHGHASFRPSWIRSTSLSPILC